MSTYFDQGEQVAKDGLFCEQCQRVTRHTRYSRKALFTCRDPKHVHPTSDRWPSQKHKDKPRSNGKVEGVGLFEDE